MLLYKDNSCLDNLFKSYTNFLSEFELKNWRSTASVGILLSLVLTLDVFCTHESLTSQCKWHMHRPCTIKSLHTGF